MPAFVRRRTFPVVNALGIVIAIFGLLMFFPLVCSLILHDGASEHFRTAVYITFLCGLLIWLVTRQKQRRDLYVRDGFLLVALVWLILPIFGALPLLFNDVHLSFTDAYFEATSGLTATGASVLLDVENLPRSLNLWRTFLHWIGGMGIIVLVVAILPLLGIGGRQLFKVEVPTPMKESSLTPRITETAKGLWFAYIFLTIACGLSLYYAGMNGWDALIHAFTVTGLGGFSSYNNSLAHFQSIYIETVTVFFALLAGMNYATHYLALTRHSLNPYFKDPEIRVYFGVLLLSILLLGCYLRLGDVHFDFIDAMRYATFHVVSIATSLGLTTQDYTQWPVFAQLWLLFLGSFVSCSGSTGGGIKLMRAII
ncbi:MAG: TrkH family potassium uptake protein, partial [Rhodocyclaceae bacterium]|nr:TrkH family potassium uptake protein [Rhodocyclaceae bacterium]